ncbi:M48 family metallopeptidase [bacterium AH-315-N03]|nr:M48 family metallopeptidase [bacterium AH-315-N03]
MAVRPIHAVFASLWLLPISGCAAAGPPRVAPVEAPSVSTAERIGALLDHTVMGCVASFPNPALDAYVDSVGARLAAHSPADDWTFRLLAEHRPLAFALPGRYVYVTIGLVVRMRSEAELAATLAHEMGHELAGHTEDRLAGALALEEPLARPFPFDREVEADRHAVRLLRQSGYEPAALSAVLRFLGVLFPAYGDRLGERADIMDRQLATQTETSPGERGRERFLRALDGMVVSIPGPSVTAGPDWRIGTVAASPCEPIVLYSADGQRLAISARLRQRPDEVWRRTPSFAGFEIYVRHEEEDTRLVIWLAVGDGTGTWRTLRYDAEDDVSEERAVDVIRSMLGATDTGQRIRMVRAQAGESVRALHRRACPDADLGLVASLSGLVPDALLRRDDAIRCIEEWDPAQPSRSSGPASGSGGEAPPR